MKAKDIAVELEKIRRRAGGTLRPSDVVTAAQDPDHRLHGQFEWDDEKAGHEYRLWQARQLIRTTVTVLEGTTQEIRAYISLEPDRTKEMGYRLLRDVLVDPELRQIALAEALEELKIFRAKYQQLQELAPVFAAARRVTARVAGKGGRKR